MIPTYLLFLELLNSNCLMWNFGNFALNLSGAKCTIKY